MRHHVAIVLLAAACGAKPPAPAPPVPTTASSVTAQPAQGPSDEVARWTAKLGDPDESERAVTELEELGDPAAIPALAQAWKEQGRPARIAAVIVSIARGHDGRAAHWDAALPFLIAAVGDARADDVRSIDSAQRAVEALGEAKLGLDTLAAVARRPVDVRMMSLEVGAIRALGGFSADKDKAAAVLIDNVTAAPPARRRATASHDAMRDYELYLAHLGASINALGQLKVPAAAQPIVLAMYRAPELFMQERRALVGLGAAAEEPLRKAIRGENAEVEALFKAEKLDVYCGETGADPCRPVSAKLFYPAVVLGDLHAAAAVPELMAVAESAPLPSYYADDAPGALTQVTAALDALHKIGSPRAAGTVRALWLGANKADPFTRASAIAAYAYVTRDQAGVDELAKIAADNAENDDVRMAAASAVAWLGGDAKYIAGFQALAKKYLDASARKAKEAARLQPAANKLDAQIAAGRQATEDAKARALQVANDKTASVDQIKAATAAAQKATDAYKQLRKKAKDLAAPFKQADAAAKAYVGYARMFQQHIAGIELGIRCKADVACFAAALTATSDDVAAAVAKHVPDVAAWTADERQGLVDAVVARALIEIGKRGTAASSYTDAVLALAPSEERPIRNAVLLALPLIAPRPCAACAAKLEAAVHAGEGKTTLADLTPETQIVRAYVGD